MTVDENWLTRLVFSHEFEHNLVGPEFKISDFLGLEIVIHRDSVLALNGGNKGDVLGTIKDALNPFFTQPLRTCGRPNIS
jgi:hypothetical protein